MMNKQMRSVYIYIYIYTYVCDIHVHVDVFRLCWEYSRLCCSPIAFPVSCVHAGHHSLPVASGYLITLECQIAQRRSCLYTGIVCVLGALGYLDLMAEIPWVLGPVSFMMRYLDSLGCLPLVFEVYAWEIV